MKASVHKFISTLFLGVFSVFASISAGVFNGGVFNIAIAADQETLDQEADQTDLLTELAQLNTLTLSKAAVSTLQGLIEMAVKIERPYRDGGQLSTQRSMLIAGLDIQTLVEKGMTRQSYRALKGGIQALTKFVQEEGSSSTQTLPPVHPASQQLGMLALKTTFSPYEWPMALQLGALEYGPWCFDVYGQTIKRLPVNPYLIIAPAVSSYGTCYNVRENALVFSTHNAGQYKQDGSIPDLDTLKLMLPVYDASKSFTHLLCDFNDRDCTGEMRTYFFSLLPTDRFKHVEISHRGWSFFNTPEELDIFTQMIATSTQLKGLVLMISTHDKEQEQISQGIGRNQSLELLVLKDWDVFPNEWQDNRALKYIMIIRARYTSGKTASERVQAIEKLGFTKRDNEAKKKDNQFFNIYSVDTLTMCDLYIRNDIFSDGFPQIIKYQARIDKFNNFPK